MKIYLSKIHDQMSTRLSNESGAALLLVILIGLFLTVLLGVAFQGINMNMREVQQKRAINEAFTVAEAGIERTLFEFRRNPNWVPVSGRISVDYDDGRLQQMMGVYALQIQSGGVFGIFGNTQWVQSIGTSAVDQSQRIIVARIFIDTPTRFLVSTPGQLNISSGARINADIFGQSVNFNVNSALTSPRAQNIAINGDVYYTNQITNQNDPNVSISGNAIRFPSVTFPGVDLAYYQQVALENGQDLGYIVDGDLTINLEQLELLSHRPNFQPLIIFAGGDITIHGSFNNSILIVAGGNIIIDGDIVPSGNYPPNGAPQIGLLAKQDIVIDGNTLGLGGDLNLEAFMMADGGGASKGVVKSVSDVALGDLNFNGSMSVRSNDPTKSGVDLRHFANRNYSHNAQLNTNRSIPYLPFIANVVQWMEVKPCDPFPPGIAPVPPNC